MAKKPISFSKIDAVLRTGLHQYEPIATEDNTTEDGEIIITRVTRWIPMCEIAKSKSERNLKLVLFDWEIRAIQEAIEDFYKKDVAKQFMNSKDCHECLALCFQEHLDQLDYTPVEELIERADAIEERLRRTQEDELD